MTKLKREIENLVEFFMQQNVGPAVVANVSGTIYFVEFYLVDS